MPSFVDLPQAPKDWSIQDKDLYNKLPYYFTRLEMAMYNQWDVFNQLFGSLKWKPNQGTTVRGVRAERSPKARQLFYPNTLNQVAKVDRFQTRESTEDAVIKWHNFETPTFSFHASFQDFRTNQLQHSFTDLQSQIRYARECFAQTFLLQKAPYVLICGNKKGDALTTAPYVPLGTDVTSATAGAQGKNDLYFQDLAAQYIGGNLRLKSMDSAFQVGVNILGMVPFDGPVDRPKDNSPIQGKFVFLGSSEAYNNFRWDADFSRFRNMNLDYSNQGYKGNFFDQLMYRTLRYPMRFRADGSFPAPELEDQFGRSIPNPDYTSAKFEIGFLLGADAAKLIPAGPPPAEFSQQSISKQKFASMQWNGEVIMTDNILLKDSSGEVMTNNRGQYLQLISTLTLACMVVNNRNILPVIYMRNTIDA